MGKRWLDEVVELLIGHLGCSRTKIGVTAF